MVVRDGIHLLDREGNARVSSERPGGTYLFARSAESIKFCLDLHLQPGVG